MRMDAGACSDRPYHLVANVTANFANNSLPRIYNSQIAMEISSVAIPLGQVTTAAYVQVDVAIDLASKQKHTWTFEPI